MSKKITLTGAIFVFFGIILGAMAAHGLEKTISSELIETFEKGVKYQLYIGLGFLIVGLNAQKFQFNLNSFYWLNLIGVFLFSGCIYLYALHEIYPGLQKMALIVPLGGSAMIAAWGVFIILLAKQKSAHS